MRVVSLCDNSHVALYPWRDAGFACTAVDVIPAATLDDGVEHVLCDVRAYTAPDDAVFFLAWPPCTDLARSGARWWPSKGPEALTRALEVVNACVRIAGARPWILENPVGRLSSTWRRPDGIVHPYHFAALEPADAYQKQTCLWVGNGAKLPVKHPWTGAIDTRRIHWAAPGPKRGLIRSVTPLGLARAIRDANLPLVRTSP